MRVAARGRSMHRRLGSRALATSPFAETFRAKSAVINAAQQLAFIPEYSRLQNVPPGRYTVAAPTGKSDAACTSAAADANRVIEICSNMGSGAGSTYLQAALRRAVAQAESCGDCVSGQKHLGKLAELAKAASGTDGADLDLLDGFARADVAEVGLAVARLNIAGATAGTSNALGAASLSLSLSSAASSVGDEIAYAHAKGDAPAVAALLPNVLAHARAHALALLVNKLQAGITTKEPLASTSDSSGDYEGDKDKAVPMTPEQRHLEQVVQACQAADEAVVRVMHTSGPNKEASALTARYIHGRTAIIRAQARRNLAAVHLLSAAAHMSASASADAGAANTGGIPLSSQYGLAHLTAAHEHLTSALEQINMAVTRYRDLSQAGKKQAEAGAATQGTEGVDTAPTSTAAGSAVDVLGSSDAWRRLGWDLRAQRADIATSTAEVGSLMALWTVWMPGAAPDAAASTADKPPSKQADTLFPLQSDENDAVTPVIRASSTAAEAGLREYESIDTAIAATGSAAGTSGSASTASTDAGVSFSDHGLDPALGTARALRCIAILQHFEMKSVTSEGLFRAALDKFEKLKMTTAASAAGNTASAGTSSGSSGSTVSGHGGSLGGLEAHLQRWKGLPVLQQAAIAGIMLPYAALLRQWDKREREAERVTSHGQALLAGACGTLNITCPPATGKVRVDYLASHTTSVALSTAHIGSWGLVMPYDYASA